jgi:anti-anti-sigma factor
MVRRWSGPAGPLTIGARVADLDFDLTVTQEEGVSRVAMRGELDLGSAEELERALAEAGDDVLLDLRGLMFMDSTGVRVLLEAAERGRPGLRIVPPRDGDARVTIDETGIAPLLPLVAEGAEERP